MRNKIVFFLLFFFLSFTASANSVFDYKAFGKIPIAHEGRIKPLSRYAALLFKDVTGAPPESERLATAWLAAVLFDPYGSANAPQFHVLHKQTAYVLDLPPSADYYSFEEINDAFVKKKDLILSLQKAKELTPEEQDVLDVYAHATAFEQTKDALMQVIPLRLEKEAKEPKTFLEIPKKGFVYETLLGKGRNNTLFRVIPAEGDWIAPWQSVLSPLQDKEQEKLINIWRNVAHVYIQQNADLWKNETENLLKESLVQAEAHAKNLSLRLSVEQLYQRCDPYFYSFLLYIFGFLYAFGRSNRTAHGIVYGFLGTGLLLQSLGLTARMIILQRPPVSTLYESVLFVGFLVTFLFILFAYKQKREALLSLAGASGIFFYVLALSLNDGQDDLKVLEAVLNTRFWLGTHVIAITGGYALCVLTALMAHSFLWSKAFKKRTFFSTNEFHTRIYQASVWALLFVAGGTLLGGVWADQSWGRFWGWDPKENGALLIVLWLTWILHAKVSKRFKREQYVFGCAFLGMIVGLSWIGVNLLGVGLHSYGFTDNLAQGFAAFCALDSAFLVFIWLRGRKHGAFI